MGKEHTGLTQTKNDNYQLSREEQMIIPLKKEASASPMEGERIRFKPREIFLFIVKEYITMKVFSG